MEIILRDINREDLNSYMELNHPNREFHKFNGPYYEKTTLEDLKKQVDLYRERINNKEANILNNSKVIINPINNELIGKVNWYWKSKETNWLEIGIVVFNSNYWGQGIGYLALKEWIDTIFSENKDLARIGLSTWSGNTRMMKLAQKLGLYLEATYRKARIVEGQYYDSISYGVLREEWEEISS